MLRPFRWARLPITVPNGITSASTPDMPPIMACLPMRTNWCTADRPPRKAKSPTTTWPASVALLAMMTLLPRMQSCATCALAMNRQLSPTRVTMPPPSVPGFMVTCSRIWQFLPIDRVEGSPLYLRSCG